MTPVDELALLLRPAGGGVFLLSTGRREQIALQRELYAEELGAAARASDDRAEQAIHAAFVARLHRIAEAEVVLLGAPSDIGAGYRRGANLGPWGLRHALLALRSDWPRELRELKALDLGDVFVVPQLLHDDYITPTQRRVAACRCRRSRSWSARSISSSASTRASSRW
jgi:agmatinase